MTTVQHICQFMETQFPSRLAESWDNVGLLLGDRKQDVRQIMTCLTVTPESVEEGIAEHVDLMIAHHPLPFKPLQRITTDSVSGGLVSRLLQANMSLYSPHTAFDSAARGINQQWAEKIGLRRIEPLRPAVNDPDQLGAGRMGELDTPRLTNDWIRDVKQIFSAAPLQVVVPTEPKPIRKVAVACGSAGEFLGQAMRTGCDALLIGETNFHTCLEAKANGILLILVGHYASERFAIESLAETLLEEFPHLRIWPSQTESDPISFF